MNWQSLLNDREGEGAAYNTPMQIVYSLLLAVALLSTFVHSQSAQGLPQGPVASKERSDLEDLGIKGKVRSIRFETESLLEPNAGKGRRVTRVEEFNEAGNRTKTTYYDDGRASSRTLYGYIDGLRAEISDGNSGGISLGLADPHPRDNRFDLKSAYEYQRGKLVKETLISNTGAIWLTRVYAYEDCQMEVLVYDEKGRLNRKYKHVYDRDGHEIEYQWFDVFSDPNKISDRTKYTYGVSDSVGNWLERTEVSLSVKDTVDNSKPAQKVYRTITYYSTYNQAWFAPIIDPNKPDWEILPQEAKPGEVILSKRNELGILSNFAATPFMMDRNRYASVEGFWQAMLYPEPCPDCDPDPRMMSKKVKWEHYAFQVAQMTGFEAKAAGTIAEENMKTLGIDWCTYGGKRFPYRSQMPGEHNRLIVAAMRAKLEQNPEVKRILHATGDLILKPDHHGEDNPPPEWKYNEIWMQLRTELQRSGR